MRPLTYASYAQVIRLHINPGLGRIALQRLTPAEVQHWLKERQRFWAGPRTCQYARAILRSALAQAVRWGYITRNVAALVDSPRVPRHEIQPLSPDQARTLLFQAREHRLGALVTVALSLGLRLGEALGLRWEAVDLETATLHVRVALQRVARSWQLVEPKSERSRRSIALPDVAVSALREHRVR